MTKWIVFDAMGVIFEEGDDILNRLVPFLRRRGCEWEAEAVHAEYRRASLGEISPRALWESLGLDGEYPAIEREYLDACLQLDPQFVRTAERLKSSYSLALLSNDIAEWSAHLRRRHGLDRLFQTAVISGEAGVRKPSVEIYRILLDLIQAAGTDCVFIDDRIDNLAPAAGLGIIPVWFDRKNAPEHQEIPFRINSLSELAGLVEKIFSSPSDFTFPHLPS